MPRKAKNLYAQYEQGNLQKAVDAMRQGSMSLRQAAATFDVPRSTISDRVTGKIADGTTMGKKPVLPPKLEADLVNESMVAYEKGLGLSRLQLMRKAGRVCTELKMKTPFRNGVPGKDWFRGVMSRHPELALRKPSKLSSNRAKLEEEVTTNYFTDLNVIVDQNKIDNPINIWNMDETGLSMEHTPQKVVARSGAKFVPGRVSSSRENITVVACVNAAGGRMPPVCIVKGKTSKSLLSYGTDEGPDDAIWTYQSNAYMEDVLGHIWFEGVFLKHCGEHRPQLLILDQHGSHEVSSLLRKAAEENIIIVALPAHSSHWLQPLDKGVFGPLKTYFNKICSEYTSETQKTVTKCVWPKLFKDAWNMALTPSNIRSGFRTTGIYPLNAAAIPHKAFAPSWSMTPHSAAQTATSETESATTPTTLQLNRSEADLVNPDLTSVTAPTLDATLLDHMDIEPGASASTLGDTSKLQAFALDLPTPDPGSCITLEIHSADESVSTPTANWNSDLDNIFTTSDNTLPSVPPSSAFPLSCTISSPPLASSSDENKSNKSHQGHRILTSNEILAMKKVKDEEKERKKKAAEERKRKREAKQQAQWLQTLIEKLNHQ